MTFFQQFSLLPLLSYESAGPGSNPSTLCSDWHIKLFFIPFVVAGKHGEDKLWKPGYYTVSVSLGSGFWPSTRSRATGTILVLRPFLRQFSLLKFLSWLPIHLLFRMWLRYTWVGWLLTACTGDRTRGRRWPNAYNMVVCGPLELVVAGLILAATGHRRVV